VSSPVETILAKKAAPKRMAKPQSDLCTRKVRKNAGGEEGDGVGKGGVPSAQAEITAAEMFRDDLSHDAAPGGRSEGRRDRVNGGEKDQPPTDAGAVNKSESEHGEEHQSLQQGKVRTKPYGF